MPANIVLASSSKYRKSLLAKIFNDIQTHAPKVDERAVSIQEPIKLAQHLAYLKAHDVAQHITEHSIIIGSDQVASCEGELLHQPGNHENNIQQLMYCSGKQVSFHTAICLIDTKTQTTLEDIDTTTVKFKELSKQQVTNYVSREPAFDCAGGFKVEGLGISLFEKIDSTDPNALIGLPMIKLCNLLEKLGVHIL